MPSSPDSSSDSSAGSPHHTYDGPNIEAENCLPGVVSHSLLTMHGLVMWKDFVTSVVPVLILKTVKQQIKQ